MILNMKRVVSTLLLGFFVIFFEEVNTEVVISPVNVTVFENQAATLTCTLEETTEAVQYFTWYYKRSSEVNEANVGILNSACSNVVVTINTSLYEYACPRNTQNTWTIKKVTRKNHGDRYKCNIETSTGYENSEYTFIQVQGSIKKLTNKENQEYMHVSKLKFSSGEVSEQHQTDGQCMCQTSEKTALIVGLVLGALCCIVTIYATYVTILKNRLLKKVTSSVDRSGSESRYANPAFASNVTEGDRYGGNTRGDHAASVQRYTDLSRYKITDTHIYDVINRK